MLQWKTWEVRVCMPSEAQMVLLQTVEAGHEIQGSVFALLSFSHALV